MSSNVVSINLIRVVSYYAIMNVLERGALDFKLDIEIYKTTKTAIYIPE